jgi:HK97 family phage prohead protease
MERKLYHAEWKEVDGFTYEATITTGAEDREGEIVLPSGGQLENYMRNPVVLFAHRYAEPPVAKAQEIAAQGDGLVARFQFPPEGTYDFADTVRRMWGAGFLNAVSIGFIPLEREENIISQWELLEFSIVPVPANQEALRLMVKALDGDDAGPSEGDEQAPPVDNTAPVEKPDNQPDAAVSNQPDNPVPSEEDVLIDELIDTLADLVLDIVEDLHDE